MTTQTKDNLVTALVIYLCTTVLGLAMALVAWDLNYAFGVPALLGTFICYVSGVFGKPISLGEPNVSEERA